MREGGRDRDDEAVTKSGCVAHATPLTLAGRSIEIYARWAVKRINCVCGRVVEGDDDDEIWEKAQQHLRADHPDLVGKVSRDDILAQAEEL